MRRFPCAGAMAALSLVALCLLANRAEADVIVHINRYNQTMTVDVDGAPRYRWLISTGRPGLGTPGGIFHPQRLARSWFSRRYDNSPMPHSIFFTGGIAIHGSYEVRRLGRAVSHGCVRLDPGHAAILYDLVQHEGTGRTTIVVH